MDMQKKVQIVSDGSLDLSQEITKEHDIEVVPFYVSFDSETYQKEMVELGVRDFITKWWNTRMYFRSLPCHRWMTSIRCSKKCERADPGYLHLYYPQIQRFAAVGNCRKGNDRRRVPGCKDYADRLNGEYSTAGAFRVRSMQTA